MATWFSRIPAVRDNLHASTAQMSVLLLGLAVGSIAGADPGAQIISRMGTRRGLFVALSILGGGLCLTGLTTDRFAGVGAVRGALAILGFGNGSTEVLMNVEGAGAE